MKKAGRPPIYDEPMLQVSVRLTAAELAAIDARAAADGVTRNEALRRLLAEAMKRGNNSVARA